VFDTWFTSSLTPQISSHWAVDPERHRRLFPADLRPQSHEIIRTWAFYTIAKAMLHEGSIPWRNIAISGWILDPDRKKMSKSKGNVVTPVHLLEKYGADGVRYWAASARLGTDTAFDEKVLLVGKRLVTKLFNASKFVLSQAGDPAAPAGAVERELDRAFVFQLGSLIDRVTSAFEGFDYARALAETESFFWRSFTDTYLELVKARARGDGPSGPGGRNSAIATLRLGLNVLLRAFAPFLPFVTEECWSWVFARQMNQPSIHRAPWPSRAELASIPLPANPDGLYLASAAMAAINKRKTELGASVGRVVTDLTLTGSQETLNGLNPLLDDLMAAVRCARWELLPAPGAVANSIEVSRCEVEEARKDGTGP
jgi:valyl-tRNA synthetase